MKIDGSNKDQFKGLEKLFQNTPKTTIWIPHEKNGSPPIKQAHQVHWYYMYTKLVLSNKPGLSEYKWEILAQLIPKIIIIDA